MNAKEQATHKTVTRELGAKINELIIEVTVQFTTMKQEFDALAVKTDKMINQERTARNKLAEEQRYYVDDRDKAVTSAIVAFVGQGFWARFKWLLFGR